MGMCYCTSRSRSDKKNFKASKELSRKSERIQSLMSSPGPSKSNPEDKLLDQFLTKNLMIPVIVADRTKESTAVSYFKPDKSIAEIISSTGNIGGKSTINTSAKDASEPESTFWERKISLRHLKLLHTGDSWSNFSKSSLRGSNICRTIKKRLVPKVEDPILISTFGELTDHKPLKFFAHDDWSCSLSVGATSFEMLWDHGDSVIPTPQSISWKSSQQRSPKIWITGSVTRKRKAFILNPRKLIVSICGVEIGLGREVGGLLCPNDGSIHSRLGNTASLLQTPSLIVPSIFGDNCSPVSTRSITSSWFACEGFFLHSTSWDEKKLLEDTFTKDIADVLWQYLPESKFKDRARRVQYGRKYQLKSMDIFKPFKVVASSIKSVVVSKIDLEAVVWSNCDGASASIVLNDLNGRYVSPHKWPLLLKNKIQKQWECDHFLSTIDREPSLLWDKNSDIGDMKWEFPCIETCPNNKSFNRNTRNCSRIPHHETVSRERSDGPNGEEVFRANCASLYFTREMSDSTGYMDALRTELRSPLELRIGIGEFSSSLNSASNLGTLIDDELTSAYTTSLEEHATSPAGHTSRFEADVTISTDHQFPDCVPLKHTHAKNLTPKKLLELFDEFETRVKDAVLDALSSEDNHCRWVSGNKTNEIYLSEIAKEVHRKRTQRAEWNSEDEWRRMAIMIRPVGGCCQNITYNEMEFVAETSEYYESSNSEKSIGNIEKKRLRNTAEFRGCYDMQRFHNNEFPIRVETDQYLTVARNQTH